MSEELEKRLLSTGHRTDIELEAAAELKAGREEIARLTDKADTLETAGRLCGEMAEQAEAARAKALADNKRLREALEKAELFMDVAGSLDLDLPPQTIGKLQKRYAEFCAAMNVIKAQATLKETKP